LRTIILTFYLEKNSMFDLNNPVQRKKSAYTLEVCTIVFEHFGTGLGLLLWPRNLDKLQYKNKGATVVP